MCEAGRIRHHLKHNLWRKDSTILFVGYQAEGTLGRSIINGAPSVRLFGETVQVNAHIEQLEGISGHADKRILLSWLDGFKQKPKQVFVNHGNDTVCDEFAAAVTETLNIPAVAPYNGAHTICSREYALKRATEKELSKSRATNATRLYSHAF